MDPELDDVLKLQGVDPDDTTARKDWSKLPEEKIARLAVICHLYDDLDRFSLSHGAKHLEAAAKRAGIDIAAVRKRAAAEHVIATCGIDFNADHVEFKPGKEVLTEVDLKAAPDGVRVGYGVHLPVKAAQGYGVHTPLSNSAWPDRGAAWDTAFRCITEFLNKVKSYAPATDATRSAAEQVRQWVNRGLAAREAMRSLEAPVKEKTRSSVVGKLPAMNAPAVKKATPFQDSLKKANARMKALEVLATGRVPAAVKKAVVKKVAQPKKKAKGKK
jgi:hypothetical protein